MNGILCADMDNTIIYSYKRNIGENKLNVELYNGREISFISEKTHDLLKKVSEKMTIIPTSTRTEEQYKRIDLDIGIVPYALVCNGGVLLVNGKRDREKADFQLGLYLYDIQELREYQQQDMNYNPQQLNTEPTKEKIVAGLLAILIGTLGIHKFYLGYTKSGIIMLLVSLLTFGVGAPVMAVISLIEGILYLTKSDAEFYQTYVQNKKEWF